MQREKFDILSLDLFQALREETHVVESIQKYFNKDTYFEHTHGLAEETRNRQKDRRLK